MRWKFEHILKKTGGGILLEDEAIIVVNKPPGIPVLPDRFDRKMPNLYDLLTELFGSIFVVHRIDRETSGVILFAKNAEAHARLNDAFENRRVEKIYRAIVCGSLSSDSGTIDLPIGGEKGGRMVIDRRRGKESTTAYSVVERFPGYCLVEARPRTGRTHQIRVHFSAIGTPILADDVYGNGLGFYLSTIKRNYRSNGEEQPLLARTALHACSLSFDHPATGGRTIATAPVPKDMDAVLKALRKYQGPG